MTLAGRRAHHRRCRSRREPDHGQEYGEQFNRQLHPSEKQVIRDELAEEYAKAHGPTVEKAQEVLAAQLLRIFLRNSVGLSR
ncbi:hypothetical protein [Vulcaniibacterium tengchongense]|uniref:hypothetical protein n=1 Tax=Vulcaniibacterium tengchongense TaxID=1273429 RepID=UPI000F4FF11A|nr:hypothetical protein [Vulcaniibacterium tengchongense]